MPVRTDRGRAAVYRRVWGWPMRSHSHFAVAVVGAAVAVLILGISITVLSPPSNNKGPAGQPVPHANEAGSSRSDDMPSTSSEMPSVTTPPAPKTVAPAKEAPKEALETAKQFALRWTVHPDGVAPQQFLDGLRPWAMPEMMITLEDIDPSRIAETRLTGEPRSLSNKGRIVEAAVPTDVGELRLTLVNRGGWKVESMTSEDS